MISWDFNDLDVICSTPSFPFYIDLIPQHPTWNRFLLSHSVIIPLSFFPFLPSATPKFCILLFLSCLYPFRLSWLLQLLHEINSHLKTWSWDEKIQHLPFWVWVTSFNITFPGSTYLPANHGIVFCHCRIIFPLCTCTVFSLSSHWLNNSDCFRFLL